MTEKPGWLPDTLHFNGNWEEFIEAVYKIFERDFKRTQPKYGNLPVYHDNRIVDGKEAGFWHIVQKEDQQAKERLPDLRRCEHIPWPKPIIENNTEKAVSIWKNERKKGRDNANQTRVSVWLEDFDYIIILREKPYAMILITAYCVEHESYRRKLRKERDEYLEMQKPPFRTT